MKHLLSFVLAVLLLTGCGSASLAEVTTAPAEETAVPPVTPVSLPAPAEQIPYESRFPAETVITLSDSGISVNGGGETQTVYTSHDIIYYEDRDTYESGNPYGEGTDTDKHTQEEANAHTVVNITAPGAYRIRGSLSAGQLRIDLGDDAYEDEAAVVELILDNAHLSCTVAPAILFLNTYECDGNWSEEDATPNVDTSAAGANLILEGENTVHGAYVAKIFKDKDGEKKLWKQDGAIYSYMSMNIFGPGSLHLTGENEGLGTQLHLTIQGGDISIASGNDGINTNEDGVSVTTINGGSVNILAGLGAEGDGIDSNGYLVINGGTVCSSAHPASDAGMDSDLGSFVHGGTVIALGSAMDWAESDSRQVTMNLQFSGQQEPNCTIRITREDGTEVFTITPDTRDRSFSGLILSVPALEQGQTYQIWVNDVLQQYTSTDVGGHKPRPDGMMPPEGFHSQLPGGMERPGGSFGNRDMGGQRPEGMERPALPDGETFPNGKFPEMPEGGFGGRGPGNVEAAGEPRTDFYMNDKVNAFSGVSGVSE